MDQHLLKYMMSYWVKHSYQITSNNTQDNIIVDEMSIVSSTTLKKYMRYVFLIQNLQEQQI